MRQVHKREIMASVAEAGSSYSSIPFQLAGLYHFSLHIIFSSNTLNGSLKLQGSNDPVAYTSPATADWVDIRGSTQAITSGASHMWNVSAALYETIRFVWTYTSGTGTLAAHLVNKYED